MIHRPDSPAGSDPEPPGPGAQIKAQTREPPGHIRPVSGSLSKTRKMKFENEADDNKSYKDVSMTTAVMDLLFLYLKKIKTILLRSHYE